MKKHMYIALFAALIVLRGCTHSYSTGYDPSIVSNENIDGETAFPVEYEREHMALETGDVYLCSSLVWWMSWGWESLVEFTVLSVTRIEDVRQGWPDSYHYQLELRIDDVLAHGSKWGWPFKNDEHVIVSHYSAPLEEGQRYLTFINPRSLDGRVITKINNDRTITAIPTGIYIRPFDGYTVEQIKEIAEQNWGKGLLFYESYLHHYWCIWPGSMFCS